jgi:hypothetical protein
MNTAGLIRMLATGAMPVAPRSAARAVVTALLVALPLALLAMELLLGVRRDLVVAAGWPMFWLKLGAPLGLALGAAWLAQRIGRPGVALGWRWAVLALPIALVWTVGAAAWIQAPVEARSGLLYGQTWRSCVASIAWLSAPMLIAGLAALRRLAPIRPACAGGVAGAMAGGFGAAVYALHCPEMAAPFLAIWYVLGMALPAVGGAWLGARLLRW